MKKLYAFILLFIAIAARAQTIDSLPAASSISDSDLITVDQASNGSSYTKATAAQLKTYFDDGLIFAGTSGSTISLGTGGTVLYTSNIGSSVEAYSAHLVTLAASNPFAFADSTITGTWPAITITPNFGSTSGTFAQGNDTRFPASVTGLRKSSGAGSTDTAATAADIDALLAGSDGLQLGSGAAQNYFVTPSMGAAVTVTGGPGEHTLMAHTPANGGGITIGGWSENGDFAGKFVGTHQDENSTSIAEVWSAIRSEDGTPPSQPTTPTLSVWQNVWFTRDLQDWGTESEGIVSKKAYVDSVGDITGVNGTFSGTVSIGDGASVAGNLTTSGTNTAGYFVGDGGGITDTSPGIYTSTSATTVANTTSGNFATTQNSLYWIVGASYHIHAAGYYSTTGAPTGTLGINTYIPSISISFTCGSSVTNKLWTLDFDFTAVGTGADAINYYGQGVVWIQTATNTLVPYPIVYTSQNQLYAPTPGNSLSIGWSWSTASSSNSAVCTNFTLSRTN